MLQVKRLLQLADHLEFGKLGHDKFDFNIWNHGPQNCSDAGSPKGCGTTGCAIGECPIVWPQFWGFIKSNDAYYPRLKESLHDWVYNSISYCGMSFFGITDTEFSGLFQPGDFDMATWNLGIDTKRKDKRSVARGIRRFIKYKYEEAELPYVTS